MLFYTKWKTHYSCTFVPETSVSWSSAVKKRECLGKKKRVSLKSRGDETKKREKKSEKRKEVSISEKIKRENK